MFVDLCAAQHAVGRIPGQQAQVADQPPVHIRGIGDAGGTVGIDKGITLGIREPHDLAATLKEEAFGREGADDAVGDMDTLIASCCIQGDRIGVELLVVGSPELREADAGLGCLAEGDKVIVALFRFFLIFRISVFLRVRVHLGGRHRQARDLEVHHGVGLRLRLGAFGVGGNAVHFKDLVTAEARVEDAAADRRGHHAGAAAETNTGEVQPAAFTAGGVLHVWVLGAARGQGDGQYLPLSPVRNREGHHNLRGIALRLGGIRIRARGQMVSLAPAERNLLPVGVI